LQETLYRPARSEQSHEVSCEICKGNRLVCVQNSSRCPVFLRAKGLIDIEKMVGKTEFFGPSPPGVFLGSYGYPNLLAGPLVPVVQEPDPSLLDSPDRWLDKSIDELLRYRFGLVRGKSNVKVQDARNPDKTLSLVQEIVMSETPTDTELVLKKKPYVKINLLTRSSPHGPSGVVERLSLASNPDVPRQIDKVVSDTDLAANEGAQSLYRSGISQQHIVRMFSIGLLGSSRARRLVPTEWSITAIDDILAKDLRSRVLDYPRLDEFRLFSAHSVGNNVHVLLFPTNWMFEALEGWLTGPRPEVFGDYELNRGRKDYPTSIAGAYHASRLPALEYLNKIRRQAGAIVFLEVTREWVPLGVWRFRELARRALTGDASRFTTLEGALSEARKRLLIPYHHWAGASRLLSYYKQQSVLDRYVGSAA
jgi:DNA repair protein NreA